MARPLLTFVPLLALAVLAACGSDDGSGAETTTSGLPPEESTAPPATTQSPPTTAASGTTTTPGVSTTGAPQPAPDVITEAFDGAVLVVQVGEERTLQLDSTWAWDIPVLDGPGLELTPVDYLLDPGYFEWIVTAVEPGTVHLTAVGSPNCDDAARCPPTEVAMTFAVEG